MAPARTILLVEDEATIAELVRRYLDAAGFHARVVGRADLALAALADAPPALVVVDRGLPDADGLVVARAAAGRGVPVVVLTARGEEPERMEGFAAGADDYVAKPFSPRELVARVEAVLRRARPAPPPALERGGLRLEADTRRALRDGRDVGLTQREFDLCWALLAASGRVLTRDALLESVWGDEVAGGTRTVDQHVAQLRAKVGADAVETVRGLGYRAG